MIKKTKYSLFEKDKETFQLPLLKKVLKTANRRVLSWGGALLFVYIPYSYKKERYKEVRSEIFQALEEMGISFVDFKKYMQKLDDTSTLFPFNLVNQHFNENGYRFLAEAIVEKIDAKSSSKIKP